ncbi:MAG: Kelch repeat-containing protein, partial [Promethearchaeota archaeon]
LTFGVWISGADTNNFRFTSPRERSQHAMIFDCANQKTILFGGSWDTGSGFQHLGDTWAYDYSTNLWTEFTPTTHPSARDSHAMVYDSTTNQTILFGGGPAETWVYDYLSNTWIQKFTGTSPPPLYNHAMAYDPVNQKVILFGGMNEGIKDEFWAYDPATNTWTELNPPLKPEARYGHTMVYDSANQKVILFGGNSAEGYRDDTWAYDCTNNTWIELNPTTPPSPRYWHSMIYDTHNQKGVLFGGSGESGNEYNLLGDTWAYDYSSNQWEDLSPSVNPPRRANTALVYDSVNHKAILFGGLHEYQASYGDTWVYDYSNNSWVCAMSPIVSSTSTSSTSTNPISQSTSTTDLVATDFLRTRELMFAFGVIGIIIIYRRKKRKSTN